MAQLQSLLSSLQRITDAQNLPVYSFAEPSPIGIALEDDAILEPDLIAKLDAAMAQLPSDWDVLYLRSCLHEPGELVGTNVRSLHRAYCTLGYVYTRRFAHLVLMQARAAQLGFEAYVVHAVQYAVVFALHCGLASWCVTNVCVWNITSRRVGHGCMGGIALLIGLGFGHARCGCSCHGARCAAA